MKVAVPVNRFNQIDGHFGHCEFFNVYTISAINQISEVEVIKSGQGCGCKSNIAGILAHFGVTAMLAGGIGGGAINVLNNAGIEVIRGCAGDPEEVVKNYVTGLVTDSGISCSQHDEHHADGGGHICNH
jgi:predicted Fe-Mo cluster-binding NifX family protein